MSKKECVLYDSKICDDCGDCNFCDLNPDKICDNCGRCINVDDEYITIEIDGIIEGNEKDIALDRRGYVPKEQCSGHNHNHDCCCDNEKGQK